jgi:hypothetical protein
MSRSVVVAALVGMSMKTMPSIAALLLLLALAACGTHTVEVLEGSDASTSAGDGAPRESDGPPLGRDSGPAFADSGARMNDSGIDLDGAVTGTTGCAWRVFADRSPSDSVGRYAAAYGAAVGRIFMFADHGTLHGDRNDLWVLSSTGGWSLVPTSTPAPSLRSGVQLLGVPALPCDSVFCQPHIMVFGGLEESGLEKNDAWQSGLVTEAPWTMFAPQNNAVPSPTTGASATYLDFGTGASLVVFGGSPVGDAPAVDTNDLWVGSPHGWSMVPTASTAPSPRRNVAMALDHQRQTVLVFGGQHFDGVTNHVLNDLYVLSPNLNLDELPSWQRLPTPPIPASTIPYMFEDTLTSTPAATRMLIVVDDEVWSYVSTTTPAYARLPIAGRQIGSANAAPFVFDPEARRLLALPYRSDQTVGGPVWALDVANCP